MVHLLRLTETYCRVYVGPLGDVLYCPPAPLLLHLSAVFRHAHLLNSDQQTFYVCTVYAPETVPVRAYRQIAWSSTLAEATK